MPLAAIDADVYGSESMVVLSEGFAKVTCLQSFVSLVFEPRCTFKAFLEGGFASGLGFGQGFFDGRQNLLTLHGEALQIFDVAEGEEKAGLEMLGNLAIMNVGILECELEAQTGIQAWVIEIRVSPSLCECFNVFKTDEHAVSLEVDHSRRRIDVHPEMEVYEVCCIVPSCNNGHLALGADVP